MSGVLVATEQGNYPAAINGVKKVIKEHGKDRLLYFLELGLLKHLNGDYHASNNDFHLAAEIAENLETKSATNMLKVALTNPAQSDYAGTQFERVYIHYYKSLNYLLLASNHPEWADYHLEASRVESRKADVLLTALQNQKGNYQAAKDKKKKLFSQLLKVFDVLLGRHLDREFLIFREGAYIRYMTGLIYEKNGEYDEARVAYQKAARLYESGYAKQYSLTSDMTEQAWFDTIRMMKWAGGYKNSWPNLAKQKLSKSMIERLSHFERGAAQLVVIEHAGMIPHRDEMNFLLTLDVQAKDLVLRPFLSGTLQEQRDQLAWFDAMYADRGLLDIVVGYNRQGGWGVLDRLQSVRIPLSSVWSLAKDVGLKRAFKELPARITVPYYRPHITKFGQTELWLNGELSATLLKAESLNQIALQEQLKNSTKDLQLAVSREVLKKLLAVNIAEEIKKEDDSLGTFLKLGSDIFNMLTSQADTRNWLTLPDSIRINRVPLSTGEHQVELVTRYAENSAVYQRSTHNINLNKGEIYVLRQRMIGTMNHPSDVVNQESHIRN